MKIILTTSTGKIFAEVQTLREANIAAKSVFKRNYWSDLYYHIMFDDGSETSGSIDLEPAEFHKPHQNNLFTWHLNTYWNNIIKSDFIPGDAKHKFKQMLVHINHYN